MPSRASKRKKRDFAEIAFDVVAQATGQRKKTGPPAEAPAPPPPDPAAASAAAKALSLLGASKGGLARAKAMSKAKRKAIARKAAKARWQRKG